VVRVLIVDFSSVQKTAIDQVLSWYADSPQPEFYLAGYAGTGKTTIAAHLIESLGVQVCVAAYTGKAASVLRKKGIGQASTIHSLIYEKVPGTEPPRWALSSRSPLVEARLLVVDEVSMVGDDLADDLRFYGKKILVLGDPGQLPPIAGAGAFTRREPDVMLTEIHRQAAESPVLAMATEARQGRPINEKSDPLARVARLTRSEIVEGQGQIICGTHRSRWGATKLIRENAGFHGSVSPGERVICRRNNRELGIYNGMLGTVVENNSDPEEELLLLLVQMDDLIEPVRVTVDPTLFLEHSQGPLRAPRYSRDVQLFDFGYVITCHSAQGSEWPEVRIIDDSGVFREDRHRWLYTAITRASEKVTVLRR
jgi:exodeoxyribonuclease-5